MPNWLLDDAQDSGMETWLTRDENYTSAMEGVNIDVFKLILAARKDVKRIRDEMLAASRAEEWETAKALAHEGVEVGAQLEKDINALPAKMGSTVMSILAYVLAWMVCTTLAVAITCLPDILDHQVAKKRFASGRDGGGYSRKDGQPFDLKVKWHPKKDDFPVQFGPDFNMLNADHREVMTAMNDRYDEIRREGADLTKRVAMYGAGWGAIGAGISRAMSSMLKINTHDVEGKEDGNVFKKNARAVAHHMQQVYSELERSYEDCQKYFGENGISMEAFFWRGRKEFKERDRLRSKLGPARHRELMARRAQYAMVFGPVVDKAVQRAAAEASRGFNTNQALINSIETHGNWLFDELKKMPKIREMVHTNVQEWIYDDMSEAFTSDDITDTLYKFLAVRVEDLEMGWVDCFGNMADYKHPTWSEEEEQIVQGYGYRVEDIYACALGQFLDAVYRSYYGEADDHAEPYSEDGTTAVYVNSGLAVKYFEYGRGYESDLGDTPAEESWLLADEPATEGFGKDLIRKVGSNEWVAKQAQANAKRAGIGTDKGFLRTEKQVQKRKDDRRDLNMQTKQLMQSHKPEDIFQMWAVSFGNKKSGCKLNEDSHEVAAPMVGRHQKKDGCKLAKLCHAGQIYYCVVQYDEPGNDEWRMYVPLVNGVKTRNIHQAARDLAALAMDGKIKLSPAPEAEISDCMDSAMELFGFGKSRAKADTSAPTTEVLKALKAWAEVCVKQKKVCIPFSDGYMEFAIPDSSMLKSLEEWNDESYQGIGTVVNLAGKIPAFYIEDAKTRRVIFFSVTFGAGKTEQTKYGGLQHYSGATYSSFNQMREIMENPQASEAEVPETTDDTFATALEEFLKENFT